VVPRFWVLLMAELFGTSQKLACRLWRQLDVSAALLYQIGICDSSDAARPAWVNRVRHLSRLLPPAALLEASAKVAPEGQVRPREVTDFEETVLGLLDNQGQWRW
jgi:hypothetical protein